MKKRKFDWLPAQMPRVAELIAEQRATVGAEHVALCWQRGVIERLPGWWWCAEGSLQVGVPGDMVMVEEWLLARERSADAAALYLCPVGIDDDGVIHAA